jgi:hypothetical protein
VMTTLSKQLSGSHQAERTESRVRRTCRPLLRLHLDMTYVQLQFEAWRFDQGNSYFTPDLISGGDSLNPVQTVAEDVMRLPPSVDCHALVEARSRNSQTCEERPAQDVK